MPTEEATTREGDVGAEDSTSAEPADLFATIACSCVSQLRSHLAVSEDHYRLIASTSHNSPRDYFLYSVLDDALGAGMALMRWGDMLAAGANERPTAEDVVSRVLAEAFEVEASVWTRKLMEALAHLICFSTSNEPIYYEHWILLNKLRDALNEQRDQRSFYDCESNGLHQHAVQLHRDAIAAENQTDPAKRWYAKKPLPNAFAKVRVDDLLTSFNALLKRAVPLARPHERLCVGVSYRMYSVASSNIHFSIGPGSVRTPERALAAARTQCGVLEHRPVRNQRHHAALATGRVARVAAVSSAR